MEWLYVRIQSHYVRTPILKAGLQWAGEFIGYFQTQRMKAKHPVAADCMAFLSYIK